MRQLGIQELPMESMEFYRKLCLKQQTELRRMMMEGLQFEETIQLFLKQHAMLHSRRMVQTEPWSFEDEVFNGMSETQVRRIPKNCEHSVAWLTWHSARCEDITMNLLVANSPQILHLEGWLEKMKVTARDTGNAMDEEKMADFNNQVEIEALRDYRVAVGRRTREIVRQLKPAELKQKVMTARLQRVTEEGAVVEAARGIMDYWGRCTMAGLLLMPATRHPLIHLNEALKVKRKS
jgi:hypothetical protein